MKQHQTIAQFLNIVDFPFEIVDKNGKVIYYEDSEAYWLKYEYDSDGNQIYYENSEGYWFKYIYDSKGNKIFEPCCK